MTDPLKIPRPGRPSVGPRVGKSKAKPKGANKIVEGGSGGVTSNSIGKATSEPGTRPFGRSITRQVYAMTSGPQDIGYNPVQRVQIQRKEGQADD